jgi:dynein heavy chain
LELPPEQAKTPAPDLGIMPLERHKGAKLVWLESYGKPQYEEPKEFTETFKDFCFASLYIKEEVIKAL